MFWHSPSLFLHIIFYWFLANGYLGILLYVYLLMQFLPIIVLLYFTIIGYSWFAYISSINKNIYRFIFNKKLQTTYSIITNNLVSKYTIWIQYSQFASCTTPINKYYLVVSIVIEKPIVVGWLDHLIII